MYLPLANRVALLFQPGFGEGLPLLVVCRREKRGGVCNVEASNLGSDKQEIGPSSSLPRF